MNKEYLNKIIELIKNDLKISSNVIVSVKSDGRNPCLHIENHKNIIEIIDSDDWNLIYQVSHELMHLCFYENRKFSKQNKQLIFVEEIVCEAYSICNLRKYAMNEYIKWVGYLHEDMYKKCCEAKDIQLESIEELNKKLKGYKDFNTRQYIHPLALKILHIIENERKEFEDFWRYEIYFDVTNKKSNNKIYLEIREFLMSKNLIKSY